MEDEIKRILQDKQFHLQIRADGNNTKCVGKKRFNGSVTHVFGKSMCYAPSPSHFGQGKIIYAHHLSLP
jgi:hypothetical protein